MKKLDVRIPASLVWPGVEDYEDLGPIDGLVRGYNAEVVDRSGNTFWSTCVYVEGDPEEYFYDDIRVRSRMLVGWELTGRLVFRGYFRELCSEEERETFVEDVADAECYILKQQV